jgi:hypothetical protein
MRGSGSRYLFVQQQLTNPDGADRVGSHRKTKYGSDPAQPFTLVTAVAQDADINYRYRWSSHNKVRTELAKSETCGCRKPS